MTLLWSTLVSAFAVAAPTSHPPLALEQLSVAELPPPDAYRLYVGDPTMPHLVDGRLHVVDGRSMKYLGLVGTGFAGQTTLSRDNRTLYVATTYHSRLQRGARTDVVEAYDTSTLALQFELEIPGKHIESLPMRALMATTSDDRFLLVQNATPATSVTVADIASRKVAAEIALPGCYGVIPWPARADRFSAICGDGTITTVTLDEQGKLTGKTRSAAFFDPDQDPVFTHYEIVGDLLRFVSYHGIVHELALAGDSATQVATWSLVDEVSAKRNWRPGGYELFAIDLHRGRLYIGMHEHGREGSHKNPAKEIWVFDLANHRRVARWPGNASISMTVLPAEQSRLVLLTEPDNKLVAYDLKADGSPPRPDAISEPVGETPVYLRGR